MRRFLFLLALLALTNIPTFGQQQATFTQYMFNGMAINPAYAGSHEALSVSVLSRFQNIGLPGAPTTQSLSIHSPLLNQRFALGLLVVHDKISVISQTGISGIYAYRLPLKKGATLSMGVQAGLSVYRASYSQLELFQQDPLFAQDVNQSRPNFGVGVYYTTRLWYAGVSMPHMMNNIFQSGTNFETIKQSSPLILSGGYVFTLNRLMKLKPNFLFKWIDSRPVEFDINANLLFDEVLWFGVSYRMSETLSWLLELQVTDQLKFGYSYSTSLGPIRQAELGSHEVLLNYRFRKLSKGIVTPRYF
ncbi:MAG: type IX secretion system membrane protein PorP/SprF [Cytophagales bacterium]|nr:type IX secretion system membrane protein PorP/SprF [Cytophagales bacterium]